MTGHGAKFGRKKEEAIAALLSHWSMEEAARAIDLSPKTLLRWLKLPEFQEVYRKARNESVGHSTARLQQASGAAATTLMKLMLDQNQPASSRIRAAQCILERAHRALELEELEARIARLEAADAEANQRQKEGTP